MLHGMEWTIPILTLVSTAGLLLAWNTSNIFNIVLRPFYGKHVSREYVAAHGNWGYWLTCPRCHAPYLVLGLYALFLSLPANVIVPVVLFSVAPLLSLILGLNPPNPAKQSKSDKVKPTQTLGKGSNRAEEILNVPASLQPRFDRIVEDSKGHTAFLKEKLHLLQCLTSVGQESACSGIPGHEELIEEYREKRKQLDALHAESPGECPTCVLGRLINMYVFLLDEKEQAAQKEIDQEDHTE